MVEFFSEQSVFISIGTIAIRWYGIAYVAAFWIAWAILPALGARRDVNLSREQWTSLLALGAAGALIGGRIGYVLLYEISYFFANPGEIIRIWQGGMSSHGGFLGAALGVWVAVHRIASPLAVADVMTVPAALGLAIGRLANVANGEFGNYGLYEAVADFGIAAVCYVMLRNSGEKGIIPGNVFATFLILYSIARFLLEYVRVQEWPFVWGLSLGQLYTIPLILFGILLWHYAHLTRV